MKLSPTTTIVLPTLLAVGWLVSAHFTGALRPAPDVHASERRPVSVSLPSAAAAVPVAPLMGSYGSVAPEVELHGLRVHAPNCSVGAPLALIRDGEEASWKSGVTAVVDADHVAHFKELRPGNYRLAGTHCKDQMHVRIPSEAITFEVQVSDSFRIVGIEEGSAAAGAGVQQGDIVIAVDGTSLSTAEGVRKFAALGQADATSMTVVRGGEEMEFALASVHEDHGSHGMKVEPWARPVQ